jgi:periplasmic protein TonB
MKFISSFFLLTSVFLIAHSQTVDSIKTPPRYPGGCPSVASLLASTNENIKDCMGGYLVIELTIDSSGKIVKSDIYKSLSPDCDKVALNIVKKMADFIPAISTKGKHVSSRVFLPIQFQDE